MYLNQIIVVALVCDFRTFSYLFYNNSICYNVASIPKPLLDAIAKADTLSPHDSAQAANLYWGISKGMFLFVNKPSPINVKIMI